MRQIVIFGATSAIAHAAARYFAKDGDRLLLVGRDPRKLEAVRADLAAYGASQVESMPADLGEIGGHSELLGKIEASMPDYDTVLVAHGVLGDPEANRKDYAKAEEVFRVNLLSVVSLLTGVANRFEERKRGTIAVISSVAGDRGRKKNYIYNASKAGLTVFLQGLRQRLFHAGVSVVTIKPGFVETPMTEGLTERPFAAKPDRVGGDIYRAIVRRRDVVFTPWFWRYIMLIVRHIPECVFKRTAI